MSKASSINMVAKTLSIVSLLWCLASLTEIHALSVSFSESDVSVTEGDGHATVIVTKTGRSRGNISCTLIPLSLDQARSQYGFESSGNPDPAEIDDDFGSAQLELVFEPGVVTVDQQLSISVVNDDVYEVEEVFVVRLNVSASDAVDESELEVGIQHFLIRISPDSGDVSTVKVLTPRTSVSEDAGLVEDFVTLYREGLSELPLMFTVGVNSDSGVTATIGADYEFQTGEYTLQPTETNITIPLRVVEDEIAEGVETFTWTVSQTQTEDFRVQIVDNDVITVRIANSSEVVVTEGDTITLCAEILSPSRVDARFFLLGNLLPGTADMTDYVATGILYTLNGDQRRECRDVDIRNDTISEATERFSLSLSWFPTESLIDLEPNNTITFLVKDNDVPELQITLPGNVSGSGGVILGEGDNDVIVISAPETLSTSVLVSVTVSLDSAEKDADFVIREGNFTLSPDNSSLVIPVSILDDEFVENNEKFTLIISQPNSGEPPLEFSFTITDNDRVTVGFANGSSVSVDEGEVVRVCGGLLDTTPNLLQREIVLQGYTLPGTAMEVSDFKVATWNFTFSSSSPDVMCVAVDVLNDSDPEAEEMFSLTIHPIPPASLISVQPSIIEITINNDDAVPFKVEVFGSAASNATSTLMENNGTFDRLIRISIPRDHPFPLMYQISTIPSSSDDFSVEVGSFTFSPDEEEHFLVVMVLDDDIAEEDEEFSIIITFPGQPTEIITFSIVDNDDLTVGFANDSNLTVAEGETVRVCAVIISPEAVDRSVILLARTEPVSAIEGKDYMSATVDLTISGSQRTACTDIVTIKNKKPEHSRVFKVHLEVRGHSGVKLEQDLLTVEIADSSATAFPIAPTITGAELVGEVIGDITSYDFMFTWEVEQDELRPIDDFSGSVTALRVPQTNTRKKRQDSNNQVYNFTVDSSNTDFTVVDIVLTQEYIIQVCSRNGQGSNCSSPAVFSLVSLLSTTTGGVDRDDGRGKDVGVIAGVTVAATLVALVIFFLLMLACFCFLRCWFVWWTSYHPEDKEKKNKEELESYRGESGWSGRRGERRAIYVWQKRDMDTSSESDFDSDLGDAV